MAATESGRVALIAATQGYVEQVAAVWQSAWRDGHLGRVPAELISHRTPEDFRRRTANRVGSMILAVDQATAGSPVVGSSVVEDDEVEQLHVRADWRGTGVAAALLAHAEQAIALGHETAWLAVVPGNDRARRFYERCGWRDAGAYDNPADTAEGIVLVPTRRYEKRLRGSEKRS
jgi:GNAT superfamily N-acetyltransferase